MLQWRLERLHRIVPYGHDPLYAFERVTEHEFAAFERAKQIGYRLELRAFYIFKQQRRAFRLVHFHMYCGHFQIRVYFFLNPDQMSMLLQIVDAVFHIAIFHGMAPFF
ncbi:hypothetical protein D3C76_1384480 [compost metagenome]